jgi:hypothetical protein
MTFFVIFLSIGYTYNNFNKPLEEIKIVIMRKLVTDTLIPIWFILSKTRFRKHVWLIPILFCTNLTFFYSMYGLGLYTTQPTQD